MGYGGVERGKASLALLKHVQPMSDKLAGLFIATGRVSAGGVTGRERRAGSLPLYRAERASAQRGGHQ